MSELCLYTLRHKNCTASPQFSAFVCLQALSAILVILIKKRRAKTILLSGSDKVFFWKYEKFCGRLLFPAVLRRVLSISSLVIGVRRGYRLVFE
jgi:hypothetical protein